MSEILHVYTLPEFWEISDDLLYVFVYKEFMYLQGCSHPLWAPKVSVKQENTHYCLIATRHQTAPEHISAPCKDPLNHLDEVSHPQPFLQVFWATAYLNNLYCLKNWN